MLHRSYQQKPPHQYSDPHYRTQITQHSTTLKDYQDELNTIKYLARGNRYERRLIEISIILYTKQETNNIKNRQQQRIHNTCLY